MKFRHQFALIVPWPFPAPHTRQSPCSPKRFGGNLLFAFFSSSSKLFALSTKSVFSQLYYSQQLPHSSKIQIRRNSCPFNNFHTLCQKHRVGVPPQHYPSRRFAHPFQPRRIPLQFSALFCTLQNLIPFPFNSFRTLAQKHPGGVHSTFSRTPAGKSAQAGMPAPPARCVGVSRCRGERGGC